MKDFIYTPNAKASLDCQEFDFKRINIRDREYDYHLNNTIDGLTESILMSNREDDSLPWYASAGMFIFMSFLFLGWFFKIVFVSNSKRVVFTFKKTIIK